ncbi:hypothetical protein Rhe02_15060 [Rhizocola hellebori]|uniref:VOC domain-containing protein n=1 Tax=Rhizocola hellebori TaxID=1392758 RepID=A0A8J3Q4T2_9ACTN|nr:VOC family protein [Rhizocola hellebori]GIH03439.1 hypothetical protein Rhe02_15060 [Rhizocola hellebori]
MTPDNGYTQQGLGVPCLVVDDLATAVSYYRDIVGFDVVYKLDTETTPMALMRGHGAGLLLQESATRSRRTDQPVPTAGPWDAALLVSDLDGFVARLQSHGVEVLAEPLSAFGSRFVDFVDCAGNVICVGEGSGDLIGLPTSGGGRWSSKLRDFSLDRAARLRSAARTGLGALRRREDLRDLRRFYRSLPDQRDVYYMFFTSGLLHWVAAAEAYVPADTNLVLIGSALTDAERAWIAAKLDRPFHHVRSRIDDIAAWQLLFEVNQHNFGWLDIDCFVLNPEIFAEMAAVAPQVSMNCGWAMASDFGFPVAGTHLLFINQKAIHAVRSAGVAADPGTYDWTGCARPLPQLGFNRVPSGRTRRLLRQVLPDDGTGRPRLVSGAFYDTLMVYQMLARAVGFPVRQVRPLARRCTLPVDVNSTDPAHWPEDVSDELFHLCGISYYTRFADNPGLLALYVGAELVMLDNLLSFSTTEPPEQYASKRNKIMADLARRGLTATDARDRFRRHLVEGRGLAGAAADRVLESGRQRARSAIDLVT